LPKKRAKKSRPLGTTTRQGAISMADRLRTVPHSSIL
jgi:hypothetical protein